MSIYYTVTGFLKTLVRAYRLQYEDTIYKEYGYNCGGFVGWYESATKGDCIAFVDEDKKVWLAW